MKDDLVELCWTRLVGKRTTREQCNVVTIDRDDLTAVISIARPAILEEAAVVAETAEMRTLDDKGGMKPIWGRSQIASAIRALATTGQEGGR